MAKESSASHDICTDIAVWPNDVTKVCCISPQSHLWQLTHSWDTSSLPHHCRSWEHCCCPCCLRRESLVNVLSNELALEGQRLGLVNHTLVYGWGLSVHDHMTLGRNTALSHHAVVMSTLDNKCICLDFRWYGPTHLTDDTLV